MLETASAKLTNIPVLHGSGSLVEEEPEVPDEEEAKKAGEDLETVKEICRKQFITGSKAQICQPVRARMSCWAN